MRKLVAGFASSVDGFIEGPNGEYDWIIINKEIDFAAQMKRYDAFLIGRKTYEKMIQVKGPEVRGITNYVCSTTLKEVDKRYTLVKGDIKDFVTQLKQQEGKDIALFGGAGLLTSLLDLQLVDELSISVIPVLLGKGKPMVNALHQHAELLLTATKCYSNGTVQLTYNIKNQ